MPATGTKRVGVIGAGMVGVCTASWLQRDGHSVFLIDPTTPGEGASFGNAGCLNGSSVTPMAMPGVIRNVPRWLTDPLAPLALRWSYLPTVLPYLIRFMRSAAPEKVRAQARALRPLVGPTLPLIRDLARDCGADELIHQHGHLYVYRSAEALARDGFAWALRRENGIIVDEFDGDGLRQLEPALSREYVRGLLVRENGHTSNPFGLVSRLVEQFQRRGGEIVRAKVVGFRLEGRDSSGQIKDQWRKRARDRRKNSGGLRAQKWTRRMQQWIKNLLFEIGQAGEGTKLERIRLQSQILVRRILDPDDQLAVARLNIEQQVADTGDMPAISFVGHVGGGIAQLGKHGALAHD